MSERKNNPGEVFPRMKDADNTHLSLKNWYSEVFYSDFSMEFHTHPQYEIMYCENGQFDFIYKKDKSSEITDTVTVGNNCFILINNGYYHCIANLYDSTKILNLEFMPTQNVAEEDTQASRLLRRFIVPLKSLYSVSPRLKSIMAADQDYYVFVDNSNVLGIMREILRKTEEPNADERALNTVLLTNKLLLDITHCVSPVGYKKTGIIYVDSAMTYINSNFLRKISVKEIARTVGVSDVYLQKMFKEQYGKTIHGIITEKRIVQAKYLLAQSDAGMNTVAASCGFGSCEDMTYAFKRYEGCSPSKYRKNTSSKTVRFFSHQGEIKLYTRKSENKPDED